MHTSRVGAAVWKGPADDFRSENEKRGPHKTALEPEAGPLPQLGRRGGRSQPREARSLTCEVLLVGALCKELLEKSPPSPQARPRQKRPLTEAIGSIPGRSRRGSPREEPHKPPARSFREARWRPLAGRRRQVTASRSAPGSRLPPCPRPPARSQPMRCRCEEPPEEPPVSEEPPGRSRPRGDPPRRTLGALATWATLVTLWRAWRPWELIRGLEVEPWRPWWPWRPWRSWRPSWGPRGP
jgi:hypothetical protein